MIDIQTEQFISQLYKDAPRIALNEFSTWALERLRNIIPFDGAIWGTGHISTKKFHTQTSIDVPDDIFSQLLKHIDINPLFEQVLASKGQAVNMSDVLNDDNFYHSSLYFKCFEPYGIERILSSIHLDERSGIFTLLTLYRFDREDKFSNDEQQLQNRLLYHLLTSASHRQFIELTNFASDNTVENCSALCDKQGIYHSVTQRFLDIIDTHISDNMHQKFPFPITGQQSEIQQENLQFTITGYGDLYKLSVRVKNELDKLTAREQQVVNEVCSGGTFKEIARTLNVSPSTVSNHLYRIYLKLGINTRSELISMVKDFRSN